MSETKWTPGPWEVGPANMVDSNAVTAIARCGCAFRSPQYSGTDFATPERQEANAHLIAAAPELYEALRDMLAGWIYIRQSHGDLYGVGWDRAQGKAEAALAKARGEA